MRKSKSPRVLTGEEEKEMFCNLCNKRITTEYVDCKLKNSLFVWATLCPDCYTKHGIAPLGLGMGQRFKALHSTPPGSQTNPFVKIEG